MIYFKIDNNGAWEVVRHRTEHNHSFSPPEQVHHVRSQRGITNEEVQYLVHMKRRGVGVAEAYKCIRVEATSSPALGFSLEDAYNVVARAMRKQFDGCDANTLINIFKQRQANEEDFYWDFEVDLDSSLTSFFWRDKKMKEDYMVFGDLVVHDTTYRTNKYDLICGPFVGMNSHGHNCMFGCGFILNERTCSFEWLFTTFLKSMEGLYPKTFMTDQSFAMNSAIQSVFPGVTHRLCIWHIGENSRAHIRDLRQKDGFMDVFDRVLKKCHTPLEFEYFWNKMTTDFKCNDNAWLNRLYELKYKWSRAYTKDVFSGGILSSQRSESTNNALSHRLHKSNSLYDFYNNFCEVIGGMEKIYTINAYKPFETKFLRGMTHKHELRSEEDRILVYIVWIPGYDYIGNLVTYDISNNNVCCTCKRFEEFGILCRHVLRTYHVHCVEDIPSTYILNCYSRDTKPKPTNESGKPP
ncbi:protein FAR1-RELATED SEQUENCE 5-like [Chenopodium quinoa]|uniref:protein FAR1-RELATED SEQUENCE 5-like n=1 Tax=Chenopodium quinoa TaxID=63459 RepID=UPI000B7768C4|nr:protein FAR1-RELATED SEQUENCE 5-like [Chenopodium quinoa]